MESDKPVLERADKIAITVAVAFFFVFSGLLSTDRNEYEKKEQAQQIQKAVEKVKTDSTRTIQFNTQNTK